LSQNKTNQHENFLNAEREKIENLTDILWTVTNCLFVLGGMTGAVFSKFFLDHLGRKKSILVHNLFSIIASILAIVAPRIKSPVCIMVSRYFFGVQGGLSCSLIPTYLSEISPAALRGQTGAVPQLFITTGILVAQLLGFRQILGFKYLFYIEKSKIILFY
jgi:MFS family permease